MHFYICPRSSSVWRDWLQSMAITNTQARLFGAADTIRDQIDVERFPVYQAGYDAAVESSRNALGEGGL
jgi:hypothetical protein